MTHKQAQDHVARCGGSSADHVSRQTTMLVVGEEGWPLEPDGKPSVKLQQVERWRIEGLDIHIVRECEWLGFVGLDGHRRDVERLYTPAMLSQTLGISVHQIRRWERLGLIKAVSRVFRLPYFDFREVAGARRLSELVEAGVSVKEIQAGLDSLQHLLGNIDRPLAQLEVLAQDQHVLFRDARGRLKTVSGQRLFDFDGPPGDRPIANDDSPAILALDEPDRSHWSAHEWFEEGRRLADAGDLAPAVEAYRMSLMEEHDAPETHFHLAEALYRLDDRRGALERYHVAAELDHDYLETWTQIGCVHAELGELEAAADAFRVALDVHPDYADAHFCLGLLLQKQNDPAGAVQSLKRAASAVPGFAPGRLALGLSLADLGDREEAIRQVRFAVQLAPKDSEAKAQLERLLRADH
jgi:tetratricopeptide (TPR) repeat protein